MSEPADVLAELKFKIGSVMSWDGQNVASGYLNDLEGVVAGETKYQLSFQMEAPASTSNVTYQVMSIEVNVHHHLDDFLAEESYTAVVMTSDQVTLMAAGFWRDMDSVFDLASGGEGGPQVELVNDVARVGDVISYGVLAVVLVTP